MARRVRRKLTAPTRRGMGETSIKVSRGRFDRSFVIRMIRDFLLALTVIIVAELGVRLALAIRDFQVDDRKTTELAAERLASDVRDIMLNSGGPVASRTVYPILRRTYADLGLEIAIEPSAVTVESIRQTRGFDPTGLVAEWREGVHHETSVGIEAELFCVQCHVEASPGDVLGHVTVRAYRDVRLREWLAEARVTSLLGMATVIMHTLVLFMLLRFRMEPLLRLRSTVANLATGRLDLSQRAEVRSDDEFGELAQDLNDFLERISHLIRDLNGVLGKVVAVNHRLGQVGERMREHVEAVQHTAQRAIRSAFGLETGPAFRLGEALSGFGRVVEGLEGLEPTPGIDGVLDQARSIRTRLEEAASGICSPDSGLHDLGESLTVLSKQLHDDAHYIGEILLLEERMQGIAETGQALLDRIEGVDVTAD